MKKNALEYTKFILERVSFDPQLFRKEYYKAIARLVEEDVHELKAWVRKHFTPELTSSLA
ncbi:MAG: hypothetical protein K1X56_09410 [Flavobacteriales bacterium]|nr:hypothetical protein [Flavobacteriales bacterium]